MFNPKYVVALSVLVLAADPTNASACGGLFCSAANPVEQSAERIVFSVNDDDTVTAIIEVQYQGPSERFAWLLPMPGTPKVGVSTVEALNAIDNATAPVYQLDYDYGDCEFPAYATGAVDQTVAIDEDGSGETAGGIQVLDSGSAGPYDYVTISADPELTDPAVKAVEWLTDNDYDVSATGPDVLRPYLEAGLNLVAFRLTKGNDVGAIRPVKLIYDGTAPSIPIRPTAVAAQEDMGIRVFVLGAERAVSGNYLSLELNQKRINWFYWQDGYDALVSEAADEAGGHGFITEFAGKTTSLKDTIYSPYVEDAWVQLQDQQGTGAELMLSAASYFRWYEGFRRAIELSVELPQGLSLDEFGRDPVGYEEQYDGEQANRDKFIEALEAEVITPLQEAQALVDDRPYLSRLYTTLSPVEMDEDPLFVFNSELPDFSNVHKATVAYSCSGEGADYEMSYELIFEDGSTLRPESDGSSDATVQATPAARSIAMITSSGAPEVLTDNTTTIDAALVAADVGDPPAAGLDGSPTPGPGVSPATDDGTFASLGDDTPDDRSSDGCAVASLAQGRPVPGSAPWLLLLGLPLIARRRRR